MDDCRAPALPPTALERPAGLLAVGSFLLFIGWAFLFPLAGWGFLLVFCWFLVPALGFHIGAWYLLGRHVVRRSGSRPALVFGAFAASLFLFGAAFWSLRLAPGLSAFAYFAYVLFPIIPWVWVPVVLAHAVLFSTASRDLPDPAARAWARGGSLLLAGIACFALLSQFRLVDLGAWTFGLAGATFVPYLLLAAAWSQEVRVRPVRAPYSPAVGFAA